LLRAAHRRRLRLAVFSDYPALRKLAAMDLLPFFDVVLTAQDAEVRRFKPDPRGLEVTLRRLETPGHRAIYVGDRPDIDGLAAARAGLHSLVLDHGRAWARRRAGDTPCVALARAIAAAPGVPVGAHTI
jgi:putative hydrolase of the HAD superfamily